MWLLLRHLLASIRRWSSIHLIASHLIVKCLLLHILLLSNLPVPWWLIRSHHLLHVRIHHICASSSLTSLHLIIMHSHCLVVLVLHHYLLLLLSTQILKCIWRHSCNHHGINAQLSIVGHSCLLSREMAELSVLICSFIHLVGLASNRSLSCH